MHELGTIYYVIDTVEKLMVENNLSKVASITLEVGEVSGIIPEYLTDFWQYAREKSEHFKETELKIEKLEAVTYCQDCEAGSRHLLPGLPEDLSHHGVQKDLPLLRQ